VTFLGATILAIVQGLAEFLPISSKGHLNLVQQILGLEPSLTLDIFLNTATLFSVFFFFRKQLNYFLQNLSFIIVGTLPTVVVAILFRQNIDQIFSDTKILPFLFLITALLVIATKYLPVKKLSLTYKKAIIIGLFQSIAILPGISRSGSTIFAGLLLGLSSTEAFNFSFCLLIPASIGALVFDYKNFVTFNFFDPALITAFFVALVVGIIALKILQKTIISRNFWQFGIYVILVALVSFFFV